MSIKQAKCIKCGAIIKVDDTNKADVCPLCGTAFITQEAIESYIKNNQKDSMEKELLNLDVERAIVLARIAEENGDLEKANIYYDHVLKLDPKNEIALRKFGKSEVFYVGSAKVGKEQLDTIEKYIKMDEKLLAVKYVKEISGMELVDAKNYVDNFYAIDKTLPQNHIDLNTVESPKKSSGGCYVATCVYGSYDCPEVWTLRRYRDETLAATWYGRAFIRTYYAVSPKLVKCFGHTKWFKSIFEKKLDRMVEKLNNKGVENTPYEDKNWN